MTCSSISKFFVKSRYRETPIVKKDDFMEITKMCYVNQNMFLDFVEGFFIPTSVELKT